MSAPTNPEPVEQEPVELDVAGRPVDHDKSDALDVRLHSVARGVMPKSHVRPAMSALNRHLRTLPLAELDELSPEHPRVRAFFEGFTAEHARNEKQNTNPSKQK